MFITVDEKICISLQVAGGATSMDAAWGFGCHRTLVKRVFLNFLVGMARSSMGVIRYPTSEAELQRIAYDFKAKTHGNKASIFPWVCWYWRWYCCPYQGCKLEGV